jgi:hypothetical protein
MLNVVLFQTFPSHFGEVDGPMSMDPHVGSRSIMWDGRPKPVIIAMKWDLWVHEA